MYNNHSAEILDALKGKDIPYYLLSPEESKMVLSGVIEKFTKEAVYKYPLWEHLNGWLGVTYKFSWEWFSVILKEKEVILFFDQDDDNRIFQFNDGSDVVDVLNDSYKFTFYVTDSKFDFLICYNDHDNLIASGEAKDWIKNFKFVRENKLRIYTS